MSYPDRCSLIEFALAAALRAIRWRRFCRLMLMSCLALDATAFAAERPNIVYILADDLGYGDVGCYNPDSRIPTPNIDRLAIQGMRFTDAHSPSGVCSPTRYGILTGRYAWRTRLKSGVLGGYSLPMIEPGRATVAALLKAQGYRTAAIGKWHLGLNFATTDYDPPNSVASLGGSPTNILWGGRVMNGPTTVGFDYFFGCAASWDMPPYAFIENDRFVVSEVAAAPRGVFGRPGAMTPGMKPSDALPILADKAEAYLRSAARQPGRPPFFLYFPLTAPHTPVAPGDAFRGKSRAGAYGDFVVEVDALLGRLMATLDATGLTESTLVIFTSDNGPENPMHQRKVEFGHFSAAHFRGNKRDNWEGGHRVPFLARWPGRIAAGSTSDETICLTDLMATCAALTGQQLPENAGEDSVNLLPVLRGEKDPGRAREATVHHSSSGKFAIRQGKWKLLLHPGAGGNDAFYQKQPEYARYYTAPTQLYDLAADPSETTNLADAQPEIVARLTGLMRHYVEEGRSTPGTRQANDLAEKWPQLDWMKPAR